MILGGLQEKAQAAKLFEHKQKLKLAARLCLASAPKARGRVHGRRSGEVITGGGRHRRWASQALGNIRVTQQFWMLRGQRHSP